MTVVNLSKRETAQGSEIIQHFKKYFQISIPGKQFQIKHQKSSPQRSGRLHLQSSAQDAQTEPWTPEVCSHLSVTGALCATRNTLSTWTLTPAAKIVLFLCTAREEPSSLSQLPLHGLQSILQELLACQIYLWHYLTSYNCSSLQGRFRRG